MLQKAPTAQKQSKGPVQCFQLVEVRQSRELSAAAACAGPPVKAAIPLHLQVLIQWLSYKINSVSV